MLNLKPLCESNFSTARIRPRLPSWIRSSIGRPRFWYLRAILTTNLRLAFVRSSPASLPAFSIHFHQPSTSLMVSSGSLLAASSSSIAITGSGSSQRSFEIEPTSDAASPSLVSSAIAIPDFISASIGISRASRTAEIASTSLSVASSVSSWSSNAVNVRSVNLQSISPRKISAASSAVDGG